MPDPIQWDVDEVLPAIQTQLYARLDATLSEKDRTAIRTALSFAASRGFARGGHMHAKLTNQLIKENPGAVIGDFEIESPNFGAELVDEWEEKYGQKD